MAQLENGTTPRITRAAAIQGPSQWLVSLTYEDGTTVTVSAGDALMLAEDDPDAARMVRDAAAWVAVLNYEPGDPR